MVLDRISTGPVKLVDIRDTINEYGGQANNDLTTFFQNNDANKWAKYKDVIYHSNFPVYNGDWWKATDGCCGFDPDSIIFNTIDDLIYAYNNNTTYQYVTPVGGTYQPLRLGDFRGYTYKAAAPIWDFYIERNFVYGDDTSYIECRIHSNHSGINKDYNLVLGDISHMSREISSWYFGCVIVNGDGSVFTKSHEESVGENSEIINNLVKITYKELGFEPNDYIVYPCLMERRPQQGNGTGRVMAIPCAANKDNGGNFIPNDPRDPVYQVPAVGWVEPLYVGLGSKGLRFLGTISYPPDLEGSRASVKIEIYDGNEILQHSNEFYVDLEHTEIHSDDVYYMKWDYQSQIVNSAGYDVFMATITGGSNMIDHRVKVQDFRDKDLPLDYI